MRQVITSLAAIALVGAAVAGCSGSERAPQTPADAPAEPNARFQALRDEHVARWSELEAQRNIAWWDSALSGESEDFDRSRQFEIDLRHLHSDSDTFQALTELRQSGEITAPALARSLDLIYLAFAENQIDEALMQQIVGLQSTLEQSFNTFRPEVDGEPVTANQIVTVLGESDDSDRRRVMWEASKDVGEQIAPPPPRARQAPQPGGPGPRLLQLLRDAPRHDRAGPR